MASGRPKTELVLSDDERALLLSFGRSRSLPASREAPGEFRELERQHEQLQRQPRRKDKALAEATITMPPTTPEQPWSAMGPCEDHAACGLRPAC